MAGLAGFLRMQNCYYLQVTYLHIKEDMTFLPAQSKPKFFKMISVEWALQSFGIKYVSTKVLLST